MRKTGDERGEVYGLEVGGEKQLEYKEPRGSWERRVKNRTKERGGSQRTIRGELSMT